jgi:hypothetical protein
MRIEAGGVGINPDGSLALRPHPENGALRPVFAYDCLVFLGGEPCACRMADEEAGLVEVLAEPEGMQGFAAHDDLGRALTRFLRGRVEVQHHPRALWWTGEEIEAHLDRLRKEHRAAEWARSRAGIEAWERHMREQARHFPSPFIHGLAKR